MGFYISGTSTITLNGTNPGQAVNFVNCLGGTGTGGNNTAVQIANNIFAGPGNLNFTNCSGGSGGSSNYGVFLNGSVAVSASNINAADCYGGVVGSDIGFYVSGATLGQSTTGRISILAGSLGTGSNENGIQVDASGSIVVGDSGTISLFGMGGGLYSSSTGTTNYGVRFSNAILSAGFDSGSGLNTINVTRIGGYGNGGHHHGVQIDALSELLT